MDAALFLRFSWWLVERHEPSQYPQSPGLPKKLKKINKKKLKYCFQVWANGSNSDGNGGAQYLSGENREKLLSIGTTPAKLLNDTFLFTYENDTVRKNRLLCILVSFVMWTYKILRLKQFISEETSPVILLFSSFLHEWIINGWIKSYPSETKFTIF